ncbi:hypothetical protein [Burkholderia gladioli]|uniref:hypothetical protein n=1 Tax=Burkholderia gladioli TaxID=28095 RepID=UPI0016411FCF|nr:hypothetical protein [Burkholderia gladioli]
MARKPAHLEMAGGRGPRQRIWEVIRKNPGDFTAIVIEKATVIDISTIRTYLQVLERGSYIQQRNERNHFTDPKHFKLIRDVGIEAPRLDKKGNPLPATGTENMWRTMRIMGEFTPSELAIRASTAGAKVADFTARAYARLLAVAGYLDVVDPGHPYIRGVGAKQARYRLRPQKYTGPRPPMVQRTKCIYDPNLGKIVWQEEPDHDAA